jgi:hypothetical protein
VMVLGAWLAGPTSWATAIRRALAPYLREPAIAYGALAVVVAVVVFWWHLEQLQQLAALRDAGVLDEEELRAEKARILAVR